MRPRKVYEELVIESGELPLSPGRDQSAFMELETILKERIEQEKVPLAHGVSGPQYARNCISAGIHNDNIKKYREAVPHYEKFLKVVFSAGPFSSSARLDELICL